MKKYTIEYCKQNPITISVYSKEEGNQVIKMFKSNAIEHCFQTNKGFPYYLCYNHRNSTYSVDWTPTYQNNLHLQYIKYKEIITFKEFMKDNIIERKIIGYKLTKPEFTKAAVAIEGFIQTGFSNIEDRIFTYENHKDAINKWKTAEVLDIWFTPVYEEEFKVGDFVSFYSELNKKTYTSKIKEWKSSSYCKLENGLEPFKSLLRKATLEEIKAATERYVTLSNGKKVMINKDGVYAEGRLIHINSLGALLKPFLSTVGGWTTELIDATYKIGCWEKVTKSDIELIINTYNEIC